MRKMIAATAAIAVALALLGACGGQRPSQPPEAATGQQSSVPTTEAASKKAVAPAAVDADTTTTIATTTMPATQSKTTTQQQTTTVQLTAAALATTTVPPLPFGGAKIVSAVPGQGVDESLYQEPHTVYAIDLGGGFHFQPRPYRSGGGLVVDVYLDNLDGSFPKVATLTNAVPNWKGSYGIVLVAPHSEAQTDSPDFMLINNVYRFEFSPTDARYTAGFVLHQRYSPDDATVYYALDMKKLNAGVVKFAKFTP